MSTQDGGSESRRVDPANWKYPSSEKPGLHFVVGPGNSILRETSIFRLNLPAGGTEIVFDPRLELNAVLVEGAAVVDGPEGRQELFRLDSFYLPAGVRILVSSDTGAVLYLGGAVYEGRGSYFMRRYDPDLPLGQIRQVHGQPPYERMVFMTLNQEVPASRLICGITWGDVGGWTSWPPHQHTIDLEEVYCYFDLPLPRFALHLASRRPGIVEAVHVVSTGDCVVVPEGYHPTVGIPDARSCYFWVMSAHRPESRRYDLAKADFGL